MEELGFAAGLRQVSYENTYITSPDGYGPKTRFERHKVYEVLVNMLKTHLEGQQYDPVKSSQISKMLADDLRETVRRRLGYR
jgi:tctex1 domain-containing protein 2